MRNKAGSNVAGEMQPLALVKPDKQGIDAVESRPVAADHELLLMLQLELDPRLAALIGHIQRIFALGDDALEAERARSINDVCRGTRQVLGQQQARVTQHVRQLRSSFN